MRSFPYRYRPLHGWRRDDNSGVAGNSRSVQEAWHGLDCGQQSDVSIPAPFLKYITVALIMTHPLSNTYFWW